MTAIRRFIIKILGLGAALAISVLVLNQVYISQTYPYDYLGGMLNDKHKLASEAPSPKVLWVGGSSGSFGINSDTLEKYLGMPVVNMSFIAPLGTYFLMNDALKEVKKGDKIFVTTEYDINKYSKADVIYPAVDFYPEAVAYIKKDTSLTEFIRNRVGHKIANVRKLFWSMVTGNEAAKASVNDRTSVYFRSAFSSKGDIISHVNNSPKKVDYLLFPKDSVDYSEQIKDINHLVAEASKRGAEVCYVFPPLAESTYKYGQVVVATVENQLKQELTCRILGNAKDFVRADSAFFDSFYHLNPTSRDANTRKIIELYTQK